MKHVAIASLLCIVLVFSACCSSTTAAPAATQPTSYWYMGTASGFDCNLVIQPNHTLTVQYGGCFYQGPLMQSSWQQRGDKITFTDFALNKRLGGSFTLHKYKGYNVLVPASESNYVAKYGYNRAHCFWTNLLGSGGLEWPSVVKDFDRHPVSKLN